MKNTTTATVKKTTTAKKTSAPASPKIKDVKTTAPEPKPAEAPAPAPESKPSITLTEDKRGRMTFKLDKSTVMMVQPAKTHYTVYISKSFLLKPEDIKSALPKFKIEAVVNPTYKLHNGKDPFSIKATLTDATKTDFPAILAGLFRKNSELVKIAKAAAAKAEQSK